MPESEEQTTPETRITYEELQNRIDYLQNMDYALWNAFYPTRFVKAGVEEDIAQQNILLKNFLKEIPIEDLLKLEKEAAIGTNILGKDSGVLALLDSVSGHILNFMKVPYKSTGGVLSNGVGGSSDNPFTKESREVKLKFKVDGKFDIYKALLDWKENWASSNLEKRYLETRKNGNAVAEGYLGLSYVNVKYDGSIETNAHLALFGLIPTEINFQNMIGPGASSNNKSTVECTCTVASGLFIIADKNQTKVYTLT